MRPELAPMLTFDQVVEHLACSADIVRDAIQSGALVAVNLGRGKVPRWRIDPADLARFKASRRAVREESPAGPKFRRPSGLKRWT